MLSIKSEFALLQRRNMKNISLCMYKAYRDILQMMIGRVAEYVSMS